MRQAPLGRDGMVLHLALLLRIKLSVHSILRISGIRILVYLPSMKQRPPRRLRVGKAAATNENESEEQ